MYLVCPPSCPEAKCLNGQVPLYNIDGSCCPTYTCGKYDVSLLHYCIWFNSNNVQKFILYLHCFVNKYIKTIHFSTVCNMSQCEEAPTCKSGETLVTIETNCCSTYACECEVCETTSCPAVR